jgi:hypothetical protein
MVGIVAKQYIYIVEISEKYSLVWLILTPTDIRKSCAGMQWMHIFTNIYIFATFKLGQTYAKTRVQHMTLMSI